MWLLDFFFVLPQQGSSSPLGTLFDHGCDAVSSTFLAMTTAAVAQLGPTWASMLMVCGVMCPFFMSQWEEYHVHTLRTNLQPVFSRYHRMSYPLLRRRSRLGPWR